MTAMPSIPKTMKGVVIEKHGGVEVLEYRTDLPVPVPSEGEILVHNEYCGVNFIDTYFRSGLYAVSSWPYILGRESAGTVVAVGSGETYGLKVGDEVVCLSQGTYAEYSAAPALRTVIRPANISASVAAAGFQQGLTALTLIREAYKVQSGEWVLVHAAAGGTGLWLMQLLKLVGANIIGTASTPEKMSLAKQFGATHVLNSKDDDLKSRVIELTGGDGVSVDFDGVGKATFDLSLSLVARKGSMISFGNSSGSPDPVAPASLSKGNIRLMRPVLLSFLHTRNEFTQYADELIGLILKHKLEVRYCVFPLSQVADAQHVVEARATTGKLIIKTST